jgi:PPOX class probable F420-dependent enzyme
MSDIKTVRNHLAEETGLATVSTTQADGRVLSSVVNCGVIQHPITGANCVAFVSGCKAARLKHIDRGSQVTISVRRGWAWSSITGPADLIRSENLPKNIDQEKMRLLLREVFHAAGGVHDDLEDYDRAMAQEKRVVICVTPERILGNPL